MNKVPGREDLIWDGFSQLLGPSTVAISRFDSGPIRLSCNLKNNSVSVDSALGTSVDVPVTVADQIGVGRCAICPAGKSMKHSLNSIRCDFESYSTAVGPVAPKRSRAVKIPFVIPNQTRYRAPAIWRTSKDVQDRLLTIGLQPENDSTVETLVAIIQVAAPVCGAVEIAIAIKGERSIEG
jgi:hypothetical protein